MRGYGADLEVRRRREENKRREGRRGGGEGEVKGEGRVDRGVRRGEEREGETRRQLICYYHSSNYTVLSIPRGPA